MAAISLAIWKMLVVTEWPAAEFTLEDGTGKTYGDIGDWTAHTGPDMQADVVGTFCPDKNYAYVCVAGFDLEYQVRQQNE